MTLKKSDWKRLLERDGGCVHCGETEAIAPNHRINRGMGGSKLLDYPENLVVLCSRLNGLIESDPVWQSAAREFGWKLYSWQNPREVSIFSIQRGEWLLLLPNFGYRVSKSSGSPGGRIEEGR